MNINYLKLYKKKVEKELLKEYIKKSEDLIKNHKLRKKMSIYAQNLTKGKYSLGERNKKLIELIEKFLQQ